MVGPPTDPASGAPPPGLGAHAVAPPRAPVAHLRPAGGGGVWRAGDPDARQVRVVPGRGGVGGVGGWAGPGGPVARQLQQGVQQGVQLGAAAHLPEGVVLLGRDAGGVALSTPHHLEGSEPRVDQHTLTHTNTITHKTLAAELEADLSAV